jgi:hypothetical protein
MKHVERLASRPTTRRTPTTFRCADSAGRRAARCGARALQAAERFDPAAANFRRSSFMRSCGPRIGCASNTRCCRTRRFASRSHSEHAPSHPAPSTMRASGKCAAQRSRAEWLARPERGSPRLLRFMAYAVAAHGPARRAAVPLYAIAGYFLRVRSDRRAAMPAATCASRSGAIQRARDRFRHLLYFATTIHDRVFLINERDELFDISIEGEELMRAQFAYRPRRVPHGLPLGSFEVVGAVGRREPDCASRWRCTRTTPPS